MGPLEPRMGPLRPKIDPCRPGMDPPNRVNSLFSWNVDSEVLQHLIVRVENEPPGTERGEILPQSPH